MEVGLSIAGYIANFGAAQRRSLRDSLKDPDKFQIHKLLRNLTELRPFGESAPQARVTGARVQVRQQCADVLDPSTCFPYAALTADFALSRALPPGLAQSSQPTELPEMPETISFLRSSPLGIRL